MVLFLILITVFSVTFATGSNLTASYDFWSEVVSHHISPGQLEGINVNVVDYESIRSDENFYNYLTAIRDVDTKNFTHGELYAFFMNVYNAFAIKMILEHSCHNCKPIESIRDISSFLSPVWTKTAGYAAGKTWSLNEVENYLRNPKPFQEDPRVHACIVCASISCPDVLMDAFEPSKIDEQMTSQMEAFLKNTKKGLAVDKSSKTVYLSSIFNWYSGDFIRHAGSVKDFIMPYVPADVVGYLNYTDVDFKYFNYDWNMNGRVTCNCTI